MNMQRVFEAVKAEPDQPTLIVAVIELERQGYKFDVNKMYNGSQTLIAMEEVGDLGKIIGSNGAILTINKDHTEQSFRVQFLDIDAICFTETECPSVIFNPDKTIGFFKSGRVN